MTASQDSLLRAKGLAFFGSITASLSHEMNNVFATVNELSGLIEDILAACDRGRPLDPERVKSTVQRISAQIARGQEYVKQLNRFAHSADHDRVNFDLQDVLERITALCQRFARLRKVSLQTSFPLEPFSLEGNPFDLQHVVFRCIDIALALSPSGAAIDVRFAPSDEGARISVIGDKPGGSKEDRSLQLSLLAGLVAELGGALETACAPDQPPCLILVLPRSLVPLVGSG